MDALINKYILEGVQNGKLDKKAAFKILRALKNQNDSIQDIAIIGIDCKFAGAEDVNEYWENLSQGISHIRELPEGRVKNLLDLNLGLTKEEISGKIACLNEIDKFDAELFKIYPKEAESMAPSHRLFLETCYRALEDGGYASEANWERYTGVFAGIDQTSGSLYTSKVLKDNISAIINALSAMIARRVSYTLNFQGPSVVIDTSCSSGLVAVHTACQALKNKECKMALAGAVCLLYKTLDQNGDGIMVESPDGTPRPFDEKANGTMWGEGVGAVLLKPVREAILDGDNIYGVIKGTAVNNDGSSNGIITPNAIAQEEVILKAWKEANIEAEHLSYIEAHGYATTFGDPIEIKSLKEAFNKHTKKRQFCGIGSLKGNIGHTVAASGIASLLKVILAMKHKKIPATLNYSQPNQYINLSDSPLYIINELKEWTVQNSQKRLAGINSFGFSGTNCHMVVEEADISDFQEKYDSSEWNLFSISARSKEQILVFVEKYLDFIEREEKSKFHNICYTANIGKEHHNFRLIMVVESINDLKQKLKLVKKAALNLMKFEGIYYNEVSMAVDIEVQQKIEAISMLDFWDEEVLKEVCRLYTSGINIEWDKLYVNRKYLKISLPLYPLKKTRYWVELDDIPLFKIDKEGHFSKEKKVVITGRDGDEYSEVEKIVAVIWGNMLGVKEVKIDQTLFDLGGDSILAVQISNSLNKRFEIHLSISDVINNPTIAEISNFIEVNQIKGQNLADAQNVISIPKAEKRTAYPLTSSQKSIMLMDEYMDTGITYNITEFMRISGSLDVERFKKAFAQVVQRQESMRTYFEVDDDKAVQKIIDCDSYELEVEVANEEQLETITSEFSQPYNLNEPLLFRAKLLVLASEKYVFMFDIHHCIADGHSIYVILRDLLMLYGGEELPELNIHYSDYAVWLETIQNSELMKRQERYWLDVFANKPPILNLPLDLERPTVKQFDGRRLVYQIDESLTEKINKLLKQTNSTLYMFLLAVYNVLLSKYSGQEDIVVGTPILGRHYSELEDISGLFVNMLAMRNFPNKEKKFIEFLSEVKACVLKAYENKDYNFETLIEKLEIERRLDRTPLFDIAFSVQDVTSQEDKVYDLQIGPYHKKIKKIQYELILFATREEKTITFNLDYSTNIFREKTMMTFYEDFINLLQEILDELEKKIGDFKLKSEKYQKSEIKHDLTDISFNL